jgi:hypothetical protein
MPKIDDYELEILNAYEKGQLKSVATKAELAKVPLMLRLSLRSTPRRACPAKSSWPGQTRRRTESS